MQYFYMLQQSCDEIDDEILKNDIPKQSPYTIP